MAFGVQKLSETRQDGSKVTTEDQQEVLYALSIGAKIQSCIKYSTSKYHYQYQLSKYQYKYQY